MKEKLKNVTKLVFKTVCIIGCCYVVLSVLFAAFLFFALPTEEELNKQYMKISEYSEAKSRFCREEEAMKHFPKEIPANAKNFLMSKEYVCWKGESFSVSFEIDKKYIENELKRHNFTEIEGPYLNSSEYSNNFAREFAVSSIGLEKTNFRYYVIAGNGAQYYDEYGIAVNDKTGRILYYYESWD